jgi:hypothetical protein
MRFVDTPFGIENVVAFATAEIVVAVSAINNVGTFSAINPIVAGLPLQDIIAALAKNRVGSGPQEMGIRAVESRQTGKNNQRVVGCSRGVAVAFTNHCGFTISLVVWAGHSIHMNVL